MPHHDTLETVLLHLHILRILPKNRKISVQDIHQYLEDLGIQRSERTIQRSMEKLCQHFDIECDMTNKPYGYRWKSESRGLSIPMLSEQESLLLMLAEQQLKALLPRHIMDGMQPFFEQARRKLVYDAADKPEREWLGKVAIVPTSQPLLPAAIAPGILETVSNALFQNRYLHIHYRNQKGHSSEGKVMPLALVQQGPSMYLVVRYEGYDNERHLALHRIRQAELSLQTFIRPKDFDLEHYQSQARFGFGQGDSIRLTFSINKSAGYHLTETPLATDQKILTESDDHYRFTATVVDSEMLNWWLAKFGDDIWDIEKESILIE